MALSTDEAAELTATYGLMSADELRAQLGDSEEEDALINAALATGKNVETKAGKALQDSANEEDDGDEDDAPAKVTTKPVQKNNADDGDDGDDGDEDQDDADAAKVEAAKDDATTDGDDNTIDGTDLIKDVSAEVLAPDHAYLAAKLQNGLKALDTEKAAQFKKLMDGEITPEVYSEAESNYMASRDALKENHAGELEWVSQVHAFQIDVARTSGINYTTDKEKGAALDDWIKRLADKPENEARDGKWFLEQAHKKVLAEFDIDVAVAPKAKAAPAPTKQKGKPGRAPDLSALPPTLGGLPAAAEASAGDGGEFAHLDKLSGMEFETALARLSNDQKARYEAM
jgi:hypothetical protein